MRTFILHLCASFTFASCVMCIHSCASTPKAPDPSLFPKESQDWNNGYSAGFKKGFHEGLVYNAYPQ